MQIRLQKLLADAGIASRRQAEVLITTGHVSVNGLVVRRLGSHADPSGDVIRVDGKPIRGKRRVYVALHKPRDVVCSRRDEHGRRSVMELLPEEWSHLYPVGRLDRDSEGLLLLTNDGDFCLRMTHPRFGVPKRYLATLEGRVEPGILTRLTEGMIHRNEALRARRARLLHASNSRSLVELELTEGRNREVRRLFALLGRTVTRLRRVQFGPIRLGELPSGRWRVLTSAEVEALRALGKGNGARRKPGAVGGTQPQSYSSSR